jgi:NADPH-dependent glutamate synthase beta subunit-like oxidoreductase
MGKKVTRRMTNAADYAQPAGYKASDPEKEALLKKLGCMITDRYAVKLTHSMTTDDPEYWMLDTVLDKEQVRFLLSFGRTRVCFDIPALAKKNSISEAHAKELCDRLCWIGCLETNRENADRHLQYDVPIFVPGIAEFMMMNDTLCKEYPQVATFFNLMTQMPLEGITPMVPLGGAGVGMHVIPVEKAIEAQQESVDIEHLSHWLSKYDKYSAGVCSCRRQQRMRGEGNGDIEGDFCIGVGDMAEYCVSSGKGRYINYDEVMEILERAERHGFVHQITNIDGHDKIIGICNCAPGVCNALRTSQLYNTPNMSRSAYRAHVDADKCTACGKCVEVCPVGAAKLGQKLCTVNGPVQYPKTLLPDETKWTEENWNPNYREDAKINCYDTGTSPCKTACPAHIAVQGYIRMAAMGRYGDALRLIRQDNPFPAVCGAICNRRCEEECTRGTVDTPIAIDEIKKFIAEQELDGKELFIPVCENDEGRQWDDIRIAVIGAGPAGMSCAYYLRTKGYPVTVFEKESRPGGMLLNGIPNFRLEKDVLNAEIDILRKMGVEFRCGTEVGKDVSIAELRKEGYRAFYIAIGAQDGRRTGVPGEDAEGVETGVDFLRRAALDQSIKLPGDIVVVGGGNVAIDVARTALRTTDGKVSLLCLESSSEMPAAADETEDAAKEGIEIRNGWGPREILTENGHVTGIVFRKCTAVKDASGRFAPQYDDSQTITVPCSHVLLSIGQAIRWGQLLDGTKVQTNRNGTAIADPVTFQTGEPDIFVGGDVLTGPRFAIDAIAAGKMATESLHRYVHEGQSLTIGRDLRKFTALDKSSVQIGEYDTAKRQIPAMKAGDARRSFEDPRLPLSEEQLQKETSRCLKCGATTVDENRCIGCGLCTTRCEFDAIHLQRDLPDASRMVRAEDKLKLVAPYALQRECRILFHHKKETE